MKRQHVNFPQLSLFTRSPFLACPRPNLNSRPPDTPGPHQRTKSLNFSSNANELLFSILSAWKAARGLNLIFQAWNLILSLIKSFKKYLSRWRCRFTRAQQDIINLESFIWDNDTLWTLISNWYLGWYFYIFHFDFHYRRFCLLIVYCWLFIVYNKIQADYRWPPRWKQFYHFNCWLTQLSVTNPLGGTADFCSRKWSLTNFSNLSQYFCYSTQASYSYVVE